MTDDYQHVLGAFLIAETILDAIPPRGVASGHLYVALMEVVNLSTYQSCIGTLVQERAVYESGNYLTRGPQYETVLRVFRVRIAALREHLKKENSHE